MLAALVSGAFVSPSLDIIVSSMSDYSLQPSERCVYHCKLAFAKLHIAPTTPGELSIAPTNAPRVLEGRNQAHKQRPSKSFLCNDDVVEEEPLCILHPRRMELGRNSIRVDTRIAILVD